MAAALKMSVANVRRIEQSKATVIRPKYFRNLAAALSVSFEDLAKQLGPADTSYALRAIERMVEQGIITPEQITDHFANVTPDHRKYRGVPVVGRIAAGVPKGKKKGKVER